MRIEVSLLFLVGVAIGYYGAKNWFMTNGKAY